MGIGGDTERGFYFFAFFAGSLLDQASDLETQIRTVSASFFQVSGCDDIILHRSSFHRLKKPSPFLFEEFLLVLGGKPEEEVVSVESEEHVPINEC